MADDRDFDQWVTEQAARYGIPETVVRDLAWSYAAFVLKRWSRG